MGIENFSFINQRSDVHKKRRLWITNSTEAGYSLHLITHFNHTNIIRFCSRPFKDVEHMNETLIANWNRVVGPDNIVFHLGDFCLGGSAEWTKDTQKVEWENLSHSR